MCEYEFHNGKRCKEEALPNSKYCILHIDLPEDEEGEEFKRINELKEEKVKEKVNKGDFNFEGAKLFEVDFSGMTIERILIFDYGVIRKNALFEEATLKSFALFTETAIKGYASFDGATIERGVFFDKTTIEGKASFEGATIKGEASFVKATIGFASFVKATIEGDVLFDGATIEGTVRFNGATIEGDTSFLKARIGGNTWFKNAKIKRYVDFSLSNIHYLTFKDATFNNMSGQEVACRTARKTQERIGDRILADYHFYREMEAKRKQKHPIIRVLELPVQYIFGYGVHPWRVIATWLLTAFSLAFVYWLGNGVEAADSLVENIYFSVVTAATPGYGGYHPKPGFYQGLASFEAIFGTFMWAAFIATFARKYMR